MSSYNIFHGEIHQGSPVDEVLRQYFPKNTGVFLMLEHSSQ